MPASTRTIVDRFERLHSVTRATLRLFAAGDWIPARGRAVEAALRALLLAWPDDRPPEDEEAITGLLAGLEAADLFDPVVVADRGPFVEQLLSLRDRSMLAAASRTPGWQPPAWRASSPRPGSSADEDHRPSDEQRMAGLLARAFTRLYRSDLTLDDHAIVSVTDRRGTIVDVNAAFCRISGYGRDELLGAKHSILKSGRHPASFYGDLWRTIASGRIWTGEICNRRKNGSYYWVRSTIIPMLGPAGKPEQYVSVRTEITADKWTDERLALLEHTVLACSSGVVVADALRPELPISYVSPSFARLFEQDEGELLDTSLRELLARGQRAEAFDAIQSLLCSPEGGSLLLRGARADGSDRAFDVRLSPVLHAGVRTHVVGVVSDATELTATRHELRDCDGQLRRSEAFAGFGTWENDIATGRVRWSAQVCALFGRSPDETETTYEDFLAAVHPHDRHRVAEAVTACLTLDKPYDIEHRCVWPDGTVRWVRECGHVVRDDRGRPARMLGIVQDVTERKQLAAELQHEQERIARTQALAQLGDWQIDGASGDAWWSSTLYRIYRRDPSSFRPRPDSFTVAADRRDLGLLEEALDTARNGREAECLHRIALPDGERRWVRLLAQPKLDEIGAVVALGGTVQDVTETMHAQDCARLLRRLVEMGENAVAIADRHGELVHANRAWRRALGHDPARRPVGALLAGCEAPAREALEREVQRRNPAFHHRGDLPMRRLDATPFVARGEIAVSHDARGDVQYFVQQFRDADDDLKHERALLDARLELERVRATGLQHAARTSDGLRGPSQSILAFGQLLAEHAELPGTARQYVQHVLDAGRRLLHVAGDMLDHVRAEAGCLFYRVEPAALDLVFAELFGGGSSDAGVMARLSIEPGARLAVHCDRMRLVQALRALLGGASRPPLVSARMAPSSAGDSRADSGRQVEIRITREPILGAADDCGLRLARLLLSPMGGTIDVHVDTQGELGDGDRGKDDDCASRAETLVLRLRSAPLEACDADRVDPSPEAGHAGVASSAAAQRRTVLHIDDECAGLSLVPVFRGDARVHLLISPSALLGIELARSKRPDAVLLDIDSTGVDAFAALRALKMDPGTCDIPVIALAADMSERSLRRIESCGFFRFVEKPLSLPELLRTIDAAFAVTKSTR